MTDTAHITVGASGTSFVGPDAVNLYRARVLVQGLKLYAATGMRVARNVSPTMMLKVAASYTGKVYKRGEYLRAAADVKVWADEMAAALPVERD
jgi:hypothetical protein